MLSLFVDLVRTGFIAYGVWLMVRYIALVGEEPMVMVDAPKSVVYYAVLFGFVMMLVRSIQVAIGNIRRGYSVLERPEAFEGTYDHKGD